MRNFITISCKIAIKFYFYSIFLVNVVNAQTELTRGLTSYYSFSGNIKDSSSNHFDGQMVSATFVNDRFGNSKSALYFDGKADYIFVNKFGKVISDSDYTICIWAKSVKNVSSNTMMLMPDNINNRVALSLYYSNNGVGSFFWDYGGIKNRLFVENVNPDQSWEFFVCYVDSKRKKIGMFKNNKLILESDNSNKYIQDSSKTLNIGMGKDGFYNGTLDDIRFYNRILTKEEISELYGVKNKISFSSEPENLVQIIPQSYSPKSFRIVSKIGIQKVQVYSISGSLIYETMNDSFELDSFLSGVYYVRIISNSGLTITKKILI
jgi:hypothetical protein